MSKSKNKKLKKKEKRAEKTAGQQQVLEEKHSLSFFQKNTKRVKQFFAQPLNAILFKFSASMLLFYLIWATRFFQENFVQHVATAYAKMTGLFLQLMQIPVFITGDSVGDSAFMVSIKNGCDGIEAMAILLFAILVYPTSWANRFKGFVIGFACLVVLNFIRIISLYLIGVHIPNLFEIMHVSVWQAIFILVPLLIIYQWINWIKKTKSEII